MGSLSGFMNNYFEIDMPIEDIERFYLDWMRQTEYLVFCQTGGVLKKPRHFAVKGAKRGNDIYSRRVSKKFDGLSEFNLNFGRQTRCLFVTLTFDTKLCSRHKAWKKISYWFNLFMSNLRRRFGGISTVRVYEAYENGYPHVHVLMLFDEMWFHVVKGNRIDYDIKQVIAGYWHSWVDVEAVSKTGKAFYYLRKYVSKSIEYDPDDEKGLRTLALCWAYRKRAFSVGGEFRDRYHDLIILLRISNKLCLAQTTLDGDLKPYIWKMIGLVPASLLGDRESWRFLLTDDETEDVYRWLEQKKYQ